MWNVDVQGASDSEPQPEGLPAYSVVGIAPDGVASAAILFIGEGGAERTYDVPVTDNAWVVELPDGILPRPRRITWRGPDGATIRSFEKP
jgi:hypothetical protein